MSQRITYVFFVFAVRLFSLVPFRVLYLKSYFVYLLLYYVLGYRKNVVTDNLAKSFPDWTEEKVKRITKLFYKNNLSAIFVEGIKGFTMSSKQFRDRYRVLNPEILNSFYEKGQDIIVVASHYGNWEWGIQAVDSQIIHQAVALYKPLKNKYIEHYSKVLREKSGIKLVSIFETLEFFKSKKEKPVAYIMAADQFPGGAMDKAIYVNFLGRKTPCLHGPESYARYNNLPVFFFDVQRVKQGYYTLEIKLLSDKPQELDKGVITQKYMSKLEESVIKQPENWLWSHKRWKHEHV